jgi:basic membrane lipoprotein Med (substrate-binding protein (PBP1-ABC) superfamily)
MKIFKRLTAILLAVLLMFVMPVMFTGCDDPPEDVQPDTVAPTEPATPEPLSPRVGFIFSGSVSGSAHNRMWNDARLTIERQLGAETYYVENVFLRNFDEAVHMLVSSDVDVIVSTSHFFATLAEREAAKNRNITFISHGGSMSSVNLATFQPLLFEPVHIAGFAAAYNVGVGVHSIGVVADSRMYNVEGVINSFILGAKMNFRTGVDVHVRYVNSRSEQEVRQAFDELRSRGVDTVLCYLETDFGITYAEQRGIHVVGYASNIAELAPNYHVAGFYFDVNLHLTELVSMVQTETLQPRSLLGSMASGHVKMSPLNSNPETVDPEVARLTEAIRKRVIDGHSPIFADEIRDNHGAVQVPNGAFLNAREILSIQWLEFSVGNRFVNLTVPPIDLDIVPLVILPQTPLARPSNTAPPAATTAVSAEEAAP